MKTAVRPLGKVRRALLAASALSASTSLSVLVLPVFALQLFGAAVPAGAVETIGVLAGAAAAVLLVTCLIDISRSVILLRAGLWLDHAVAGSLFRSGVTRGADATELREQADAIAQLRRWMVEGHAAVHLELPWVILAAVLVGIVHPLLALACGGVLIVALAVLVAAAPRAGAVRPDRDGGRQWLEAIAPVARRLGSMGAGKGLAARWQRENTAKVAIDYRRGLRLVAATSLARLLQPLGTGAVLAYGAHLVVAQGLSPAGVVAAGLLVARGLCLIERATEARLTMAKARAGWRALAAAEKRRSRSEPGGGIVSSGGAGRVTIEVAARPVPEGHPAGHGGILEIEPGEAIGVIGARGAGKSMLVRAIAGEIVARDLRVLIDGRTVATHQKSMGSRAVGFLPDTATLLPGTVADNIAGFEAYEEADIMRAAMRAGVHVVLAGLPQGYGTNVGEMGLELSARQRRAVALARALYGNPRVVVLDEPELGADEGELMLLSETLSGLKRAGVSVVIATSEPRLLRSTDRVVMMAAGRIETVLSSRQLTGSAAAASPAPLASARQAA
jgi:ABC-type protease/lipase transport system fused ATPase/permease subunit